MEGFRSRTLKALTPKFGKFSSAFFIYFLFLKQICLALDYVDLYCSDSTTYEQDCLPPIKQSGYFFCFVFIMGGYLKRKCNFMGLKADRLTVLSVLSCVSLNTDSFLSPYSIVSVCSYEVIYPS